MLKCSKKKRSPMCAWPAAFAVGILGGVALSCLWKKKLSCLLPCRKKRRGGDADGLIDTPDLDFDTGCGFDYDDAASAYGDRCGYETARNPTPPPEVE